MTSGSTKSPVQRPNFLPAAQSGSYSTAQTLPSTPDRGTSLPTKKTTMTIPIRRRHSPTAPGPPFPQTALAKTPAATATANPSRSLRLPQQLLPPPHYCCCYSSTKTRAHRRTTKTNRASFRWRTPASLPSRTGTLPVKAFPESSFAHARAFPVPACWPAGRPHFPVLVYRKRSSCCYHRRHRLHYENSG